MLISADDDVTKLATMTSLIPTSASMSESITNPLPVPPLTDSSSLSQTTCLSRTTCGACQKIFNSRNKLFKHIHEVHPDLEPVPVHLRPMPLGVSMSFVEFWERSSLEDVRHHVGRVVSDPKYTLVDVDKKEVAASGSMAGSVSVPANALFSVVGAGIQELNGSVAIYLSIYLSI